MAVRIRKPHDPLQLDPLYIGTCIGCGVEVEWRLSDVASTDREQPTVFSKGHHEGQPAEQRGDTLHHTYIGCPTPKCGKRIEGVRIAPNSPEAAAYLKEVKHSEGGYGPYER